jgi:hypothetical protein
LITEEFLPDLDDVDLRGFPHEIDSKFEIVYVVCCMRSDENVSEDSIE